jgi:nucleoside-diphosphate-sugar epimerase
MTITTDAPSFTILGAGGFVGTALVAWLESQNHVVHAVTRAALPGLFATHRPVGHVIDCIGLTSDFRTRPLDTADAHVGLVARCLAELRFDSFLLLSSTRVYAHAVATHEDVAIPCLPTDPSDLYNVTKLAGEALCLTDARPTIRVARLSNVYGMDMPAETFLGQVLHEGFRTGRVLLSESGDSARDYINLSDVVRHLPAIACLGRARLYNLAAGCNTSHAAIAAQLRRLLGWDVGFALNAPTVRHPPIDTSRLDAEFGPVLSKISADLPTLLALRQEVQCSHPMRHLAA